MADNENRPTVLAAIIVGLCLLVGLTAAGYFIGRGTARFKSDVRTVTVKGLVEKEVRADEAVWTLSLRRASDDLKDAPAKISADRDAAGVVLDGEGNAANPRYVVSKFNDLRLQLLAEATKNARAIAQQFAADSGASVGKIHTANQGMIQIFGSDGNDESGPYSPTSTPVKEIRVVSTFEFELK